MVMTTVLKINEIPGIPIPAEFRWDQMYWMGLNSGGMSGMIPGISGTDSTELF